MINEEEIVYDAIYNLKRLTDLDSIDFKFVSHQMYDCDFSINGVTFACMINNQISKVNYNLLMQKVMRLKEQTARPLLLVVRNCTPDIMAVLHKEGVSVLESSGNCKIFSSPLFVNINGQKSMQVKEKKGKAFNEAGLKVIFYFLLDDINIQKPYRQICEDTGVSLGTIKNVMDDLSNDKYVITTPKGRFLKNKKELLDVWQIHYNRNLKPKLKVKEMEFVNAETRKNWQLITLPDGVCWGGEGGAFIIDRFLMPEQFNIYTEVPSIKLMMTKKLRFEDRGSISVYQKFWKSGHDDKVAPVILIYADLMGSGNSRCIEAAKRLVENGI
ncbi:MAG: hypothetical protein MJZ61_02185 [Bacteroidales bacterium]|nr:hypothetical protein [Bacteroidales bacterium]